MNNKRAVSLSLLALTAVLVLLPEASAAPLPRRKTVVVTVMGNKKGSLVQLPKATVELTLRLRNGPRGAVARHYTGTTDNHGQARFITEFAPDAALVGSYTAKGRGYSNGPINNINIDSTDTMQLSVTLRGD